jgi:O-antigen biosynthesis protein
MDASIFIPELVSASPPVADYVAWAAKYSTLSAADRSAIRDHIRQLPRRPSFSVIISLDDRHFAVAQSLASVRAQLYPNYEVCLAHAAEATDQTRNALETFGDDPRFRPVRLRASGGSSGVCVTNAALAAATGDFVLFLEAGDLLAEHALYEVAVELSSNPKADIVYSDEDCVDETGRRQAPHFKTGWDLDLMLAYNMIGQLAGFRRDLVARIGGFREGFAGAEYYDFVLRATGSTIPFRIRHIPTVLYHRRMPMSVSDTAAHPGPWLSRIEASRRAVRAHLDTLGYPTAKVIPADLLPYWHRIVWPIPEPAPLASVIVPTRDRATLLRNCAQGVLQYTDYPNLELIIVDNESVAPDTLALFGELSADPRVRILALPGEFNYSALNNRAAAHARGEILVLLNNDIGVIGAGWLRELVSHAVRPEVGAVGAKLLYRDSRIQHAGVVLGPGLAATHVLRLAGRNEIGYFGQAAVTRSFSGVTAACLAMRRAVFEEMGGLDEENLPVAYNDVELCLRMGDHGYRIVWTPFAELFHLESASRGAENTPEKQARASRELDYLWANWAPLFDTDPFHNPNLLFSWNHAVRLCAPRRKSPWLTAVSPLGTRPFD